MTVIGPPLSRRGGGWYVAGVATKKRGFVHGLIKLFARAHTFVYRATGGKRAATLAGRRMILLTTRGRKSGQERTTPVSPFIEGNDIYVMASMAGAPEHPAWFKNLEANPEVTVRLGTDTWRARAKILEEPRRGEMWAKITAAMPDFAKYQTKTSRVIPVVHLVREDRAS
jgi:deazaflavin-dependent oxidoreductase (nitroreductase family)